jgi:hypothetical protein
MIAFDDGRWPIVTVARGGDFTIADATAQIIAFDNILRHREPFALVITHEDEQAIPGENPISSRWMEANRDLLQTWCKGIAVIGPPTAETEPWGEPLAAIGSPMARFSDAVSAERWLMERLSDVSLMPEEVAASSPASNAGG